MHQRELRAHLRINRSKKNKEIKLGVSQYNLKKSAGVKRKKLDKIKPTRKRGKKDRKI